MVAALVGKRGRWGAWVSLPCGVRNVPRAELRPTSPELARQILDHWTTREVLSSDSLQT